MAASPRYDHSAPQAVPVRAGEPPFGCRGTQAMRLPLRYKLRTLLITVTLCAISCAVIWQIWPRFRGYQARMRFERAAAHFSPGMSVDDINASVGFAVGGSYSSDAEGKPVGLTTYLLDGAWYCVYLELDTNAGKSGCHEMPCTSVRTFRLAIPPKQYLPQTPGGKEAVSRRDSLCACLTCGQWDRISVHLCMIYPCPVPLTHARAACLE
jgi:hypothetical protein